jgi:uncharacterized protein (TIGR02647 family)
MPYSSDIIEELEILSLFDLSSTQAGIKVHKIAMQTEVAAAKRLHKKGLITQTDGGYLTVLGMEAAEHAECLCRILQAEKST